MTDHLGEALRAISGSEPFCRLQELRAALATAKGVPGPARALPVAAAMSALRAYEAHRNTLALQFVGLVKSRAKRWACAGVEIEDLAQEGLLGLLQALDGYDSSAESATGVTRTTDRKRFLNYAIPFIDSAIAQSRPRNTQGRLSIGEHSVRYAERVAKSDSNSWRKSGEVESDEAVAVATPGRRHTQETVQAMRAFKRGMVSLDDTQSMHGRAGLAGEGAETALKDRIADESSPNPEELYAERERREQLAEALNSLDPAEARVLRWRFGLEDVG